LHVCVRENSARATSNLKLSIWTANVRGATLGESSAADTLHARGGAHITNLPVTCYFQLANMQQSRSARAFSLVTS
jgi:hypothetical protein